MYTFEYEMQSKTGQHIFVRCWRGKALSLSSAGVQRDGARCESVSMRERINHILDTVTHFCFAYLPYIVILGAAFYFFSR
jgi:hypothetical protein